MGHDQWYLEVNGKKFGPYTMAQIQGLIRQNEIVGEDKITGAHLEGRWITVQEFVSRGAESVRSPDAPVPPRPDEKTLTSLVMPPKDSQTPGASRSSASDPANDLFDILQAARERKPKQSPSTVTPEMIQNVDLGSGPNKIWWIVGAAASGIFVLWSVSALISSSTPDKDSKKTDEKIAEVAPKSEPVRPPVTAAQPVPPPKPKPPTPVQPPSNVVAGKPSAPIVRATADTRAAEARAEREREMERERERERERELDRERELELERERDRERLEREGRGAESKDPRDARDSAEPRDPNHPDSGAPQQDRPADDFGNRN